MKNIVETMTERILRRHKDNYAELSSKNTVLNRYESKESLVNDYKNICIFDKICPLGTDLELATTVALKMFTKSFDNFIDFFELKDKNFIFEINYFVSKDTNFDNKYSKYILNAILLLKIEGQEAIELDLDYIRSIDFILSKQII